MMKKLLTVTAAVILVLGLSQCTKTKPEMPHYTGEAGDLYIQDVTLTATFPQDNSKVDIYESATEALGIKWEVDDEINISGAGEGTLTCTSVTNGGKTGTFEGTITGSVGGKLTFTYGSGEPSYTGQSGTLDKIKENLYLTGSASFKENGNYNVNMIIPYAILKLDISSFAREKGNTVVINDGTSDVASVAGVTNTKNVLFVAIPANNKEKTYKFSGDGMVANVTWTLKPNTYYTKAGSVTGEEILVEGVWGTTVVTIPPCAIHPTCASSGGVVTGTRVEEWGICWGTNADPDINGIHYVHQYQYATGKFTPKTLAYDGTFAGFMSCLTAGSTYYVRAYIKKGEEVRYGQNESFTTLTSEPTCTETVNFGTPDLNWAKGNLGATNGSTVESWRGDFYQWGNIAACTGTTEGKTVYCDGWQSCRFGKDNEDVFTKYCSTENTSADMWYSGAGSTPDNKLVLEMEDDAVRQTLGGNWRMPTREEWQSLIDNNTFVWVTPGQPYTGVNPSFTAVVRGYLVIKGKTENDNLDTSVYMFLPCAGCRIYFGNEGWDLNDIGFYYSSSLYTTYSNRANYLIVRNKIGADDYFKHGIYNDYYRNVGMAIRPVHN